MDALMNRLEMRRHLPGLLALFSGAALLGNILLALPLSLTLFVNAIFVLMVIIWLWLRATDTERAKMVVSLKVGLVAGFIATQGYDIAKYILSQWDLSPYNPFEVIRVFGILLVGSAVPETVALAAGTIYHELNGIGFGIAFCFFLGRRGMIAGIIWGIVLETFQLSLYPGWLDIRFYNEFLQISFLGHVVYGMILGLLCRFGLDLITTPELRGVQDG